jgi:DNA-directed RNA polymerase specialized sigma subunit
MDVDKVNSVFFKGMTKEELPKNLRGIEYQIMYQYYVKRDKLDKIAMTLGYSTSNIKCLKSHIMKRYSE